MSLMWCSTTIHGNRKNHTGPAEAQQRAEELARHIATGLARADGVDRLTVWSRDLSNPVAPWEVYRVIHLRPLSEPPMGKTITLSAGTR